MLYLPTILKLAYGTFSKVNKPSEYTDKLKLIFFNCLENQGFVFQIQYILSHFQMIMKKIQQNLSNVKREFLIHKIVIYVCTQLEDLSEYEKLQYQ